jgi:hypothetical protein
VRKRGNEQRSEASLVGNNGRTGLSTAPCQSWKVRCDSRSGCLGGCADCSGLGAGIEQGYRDGPRRRRLCIQWVDPTRTRTLVYPCKLTGSSLGNGHSSRRPLPHFTDKETAIINNVREFECRSENLEFDPPTPSRLHLDRQLARKQIAPNHRALGVNIR